MISKSWKWRFWWDQHVQLCHLHIKCANTYTYTYTYIYMRTRIHTHIHAHVHTHMHTHTHTYIHTHMHTCIYTFNHAYTRTHAQTPSSSGSIKVAGQTYRRGEVSRWGWVRQMGPTIWADSEEGSQSQTRGSRKSHGVTKHTHTHTHTQHTWKSIQCIILCIIL